jgi:hypothetical protein
VLRNCCRMLDEAEAADAGAYPPSYATESASWLGNCFRAGTAGRSRRYRAASRFVPQPTVPPLLQVISKYRSVPEEYRLTGVLCRSTPGGWTGNRARAWLACRNLARAWLACRNRARAWLACRHKRKISVLGIPAGVESTVDTFPPRCRRVAFLQCKLLYRFL